MDDELLAAFIASAIVAGGWALLATPAAYLAHRRMIKAEATLGAPALPPDEQPLLYMALAALVWVGSAVVALMGLIRKDWARLGRNATWMLIAHISLMVVGSCLIAVRTFPGSTGVPDVMLPVVGVAVVMVVVGVLVAGALAWSWVGRRAKRLATQAKPSPTEPGAWRVALYIASLLCWPAGLVGVFAFSAANNAHVGATAFRCSLINVMFLAVAICVALPVVLALSVR